MTTLKVGIASYEEMKARTLRIARGEHQVAADAPKVWFTSTDSFAKVLSAGNRELLRVIAEKMPQSLDELARLTGRQKSNLSRTLKTMAGYVLLYTIRDVANSHTSGQSAVGPFDRFWMYGMLVSLVVYLQTEWKRNAAIPDVDAPTGGPERGRGRRAGGARRDAATGPGCFAFAAGGVSPAANAAVHRWRRLRHDLHATGTDKRLSARAASSRAQTPACQAPARFTSRRARHVMPARPLVR